MFVKILLVFCVFLLYRGLLAGKLSIGYERIPNVSEILDERINVLSGMSFANSGIPAGWSNLSAYRTTVGFHKANSTLGFSGLQVTKDYISPSLSNRQFFHYPIIATKEVDLIGEGKRQVDFVQPFFDHPPLGGLLFMQSSKDKTGIETLNPKEYRFVPTFVLFWLNSILFFIMTLLLTKKYIASIASFLIYTTTPTFVLSARLSMLENLLITFTLATLLFLLLYRKYSQTNVKLALWTLVGIGITTGLALATKESGIAVGIMSLSLLLYYRTPKKLFKFFLIPAISIGGFFYLYFFILSPSLAWEIFGNQTARGFFGPLNFLYILKGPQFHNFPLDGFWLFGFLSIFLIAKNNDYKEIFYGFLATLITYLFFAGLNYPWYSLPFVPFLVLASGVFIGNLLDNSTLLNLLIFFALPFSSSFYWGYVVRHNLTINLPIYRLILLVIIISFFTHRLRKSILVIICICMALWNIQSIGYIVEHWGSLPVLFSTI